MLEDVKNVEQSVTFYNVTGYIEKENRIYFAPLNKQLVANAQAGTTKPLCQWYKDYFDSVVGILSSRYQNVSISRWSPSDRTLSVQGTIDLFRKSGVSSDSKAFNYMIVKREVTGVTSQDASINYAYYMGYFITDVQQSGTNTVRLTLDIDNFTNAFYLMNTKSYSDSELLNLDIFNSTLVNCNVERQHYNRVKLVNGEVKIDNNEIFLNPLESYDYKYQKKVSKSPILVNGVTEQVLVFKEQTFTDEHNHYSEFVSGREYIVKALTPVAPIDPTTSEITFTYDGTGNDYVILKQYDKETDEYLQVYGTYVNKITVTRGSNILTIEYYDPFGVPTHYFHETVNPNSDRYYWTLTFGRSAKPTYTSSTQVDSVARNVFNAMDSYIYFETTEPKYNFSPEDIELLKDTTEASWGAIGESLRRKCLSASIHYLLIKSKENIGACYGAINEGVVDSDGKHEIAQGYKPNNVRGLLNEDVVDATYTFIVPIIIVPNFIKQFKSIIEDTTLNVYVRSRYFSSTYHDIRSASWTEGWSDYKLAESGSMKSADPTILGVSEYNRGQIPTSKVTSILGGSDWADVILSATIIKDLPIDTYEIVQTAYEPTISIKSNIIELCHFVQSGGTNNKPYETNYWILRSIHLQKGLWFNILPTSRASVVVSSDDSSATYKTSKDCCISGDFTGSKGYSYYANQGIDTDARKQLEPTYSNFIIFQLSGFDTKEITLSLKEEYKDVTENFYDPILENNPYTFYSLSYSTGIEVPLNKQKYYNYFNDNTNDYEVPFKYCITNNDAQKLALIPLYKIDDFKTEYYNDALILTLTEQLSTVSDSYVSYYTQNQAQMKNQFAVNNYQRGTDLAQTFFNTAPAAVGAAFAGKGTKGGYAELIRQVSGMIDMGIDWAQSNNVITMNQKALLAGAGAKPDVVKQAGTDVSLDINLSELSIKLNYYRIDDFSYNSIAKGLERFGYLVNRYDVLHVADRVGWNYVKLISADFNHYGEHLNLTTEQESDIMDIFKEGVTLLHSPEYLYNQSLHNHETLIDIDD